MTDLFQISAVGMQDVSQRMQAISLNAANASLPGYRRHVVVGQPFAAALAQPDAVDLQPGALITTHRPLDLAIDADDLFFGLTDGTRTWLSRAGAFRVNADGILVGERGLHVVGTDGDVRLPGGDVTVETDGRITQQGMTLATVQLFRPTDRKSLLAVPGTLLEAPAGVEPAQAGASRIRSGTLEGSNTNPATEMIGLMSLARQFESLARVSQAYDGALGRAIEKLAEV